MAHAPTTADRYRVITRHDRALSPACFDEWDAPERIGDEIPEGVADSPWRRYVETLDQGVLDLTGAPTFYVCRPYTDPERNCVVLDLAGGGRDRMALQYGIVGVCLCAIESPEGDVSERAIARQRVLSGSLRYLPLSAPILSDDRYFPGPDIVLSLAGLCDRHGSLSEKARLFRAASGAA